MLSNLRNIAVYGVISVKRHAKKRGGKGDKGKRKNEKEEEQRDNWR